MAARIEKISTGSVTVDTQFVAVVVMIILVAALEWLGLWRPFRVLSEQISRPVNQLAVTLVRVAISPYQAVRDGYQATARIRDLELKYQHQAAQLTELDALREENQALKAMLENTDRQFVPSLIAAPISSYGTPYVAKGSQDGVSEGQLLFVGGAVLGRIKHVSANQAEVELFSHPTSTPVLAETEHNIVGVAVGEGRALVLTEIPADAQVEVGDRVYTTGQQGITRDLYLGEIRRVNHQAAEPTKTAVIEPPVDFYQARVVEIRK